MSAIEFVVRNSAGAIQRGFVGGSNGSPVVLAQAGSEISLNLSRAMIASYRQDGDALRITLADGQVVTIDDYFGADGRPVADLYVSADGMLSKVELVPGANGEQYANYAGMEASGKYSPDDDLYFMGGGTQVATPYAAGDDQVGMLAGGLPFLGGLGLPLLGLLGLGAATTVLGGGDTRDPEPDPDKPWVSITEGTRDKGHVVNEEDQKDGATIDGKGTPGGTITVVIKDHTQTTTVDPDGNWTVTIPPNIAIPGDYEEDLTVTITTPDGTAKVEDALDVDTVVNVTFNAAATGGDGVVNKVEQAGVVRLVGTTDAGSTVTVTINGTTHTAVVTGTTWHLDLTAGSLPTGVYDQSASVTAKDQHGNTKTVTGSFHVDTLVEVTFAASATGGNGVVNAVEQDGVVTLSGTVKSADWVKVTIHGREFTATVTGETWKLDLPAGFLPEGTRDMSATVTAGDAAGNSTSTTGSFHIDTEVAVTFNAPVTGGDGIVNGVEQTNTVRLVGTTDAGSTVKVTINGQTFDAQVEGTTWRLDLNPSFLPTGERDISGSVTATDEHGNSATTNGTFRIDTFVNKLTMNSVEGDNIVNALEASDGITLSGTVEEAYRNVNSKVEVTFNNITRTATVTADGTWTVDYASNEVPRGNDITANVMIRATDAAGNTRDLPASFKIDTEAPDAPLITVYSRAGGTGNVVGFTIETSNDNIEVDRVANGTSVSKVKFSKAVDQFDPTDTLINFAADPAPNGSHLVLTRGDAAGNKASTLFVLEEATTNVVNVTAPGYDGFNIEAIDLRFAQDSELTLTVADLQSLSRTSDDLIIHGGVDDKLTLIGAQDTGNSTTIDGKSYSIYNFGSGTLTISDEITQIITV